MILRVSSPSSSVVREKKGGAFGAWFSEPLNIELGVGIAFMTSDSTQTRKILRMVQELHVLGYQKLRIAPGIAPSGMHWRCSITPCSNTLRSNGAMMKEWDLSAHYTSGQGSQYFGWTDRTHSRPIDLAHTFIQRFPQIAQDGFGADWDYAGWYVWMMHLTYPDSSPYAYAYGEIPIDSLPTIGPKSAQIPLPPPGEAVEQA